MWVPILIFPTKNAPEEKSDGADVHAEGLGHLALGKAENVALAFSSQ